MLQVAIQHGDFVANSDNFEPPLSIRVLLIVFVMFSRMVVEVRAAVLTDVSTSLASKFIELPWAITPFLPNF
jgi:hypothetical protein